MTLTEAQPRVERHASWLELFFDLTVVAAAIQVSHRLHDAESLGQVAACGAVFYAVWSVRTAFSVYVNVAGGLATRLSTTVDPARRRSYKW